MVAEAIFLNREEVPVQPLYYDPGQLGGHGEFAAEKCREGACGLFELQAEPKWRCQVQPLYN